jgi:hypothetical protein
MLSVYIREAPRLDLICGAKHLFVTFLSNLSYGLTNFVIESVAKMPWVERANMM